MFSVVIPLYNKELSIQNTILSVLNQSYQNFEIVVINDGSTDSSVDAVKSINDDRIRLFNQENQGVSAARNKGIKEAWFEWVALLDGDDLWETNHLEEIIKMMNIFPNERVYVTSFEYSDKREMYRHIRENSIFKIDNYFKEAVRESLIWTSITVVNKNCFNSIGFFNTKLIRGEDLDLWARLAKKFNIIKSSKITAIYRIDAENRTNVTRKLENTQVYYLDFNQCSDFYEYFYYKNILFKRLLAYIYMYDVYSFFRLMNRYPKISYVGFPFFMLRFLSNKLLQKVSL